MGIFETTFALLFAPWEDEVSNKKHRVKRGQWKQQMADLPIEDLVTTLKARAEELSKMMAHTLGPWKSAKRKHGKGAVQAFCPHCASQVLLLPYGGPSVGRSPALCGDALEDVCDVIEFG